MQDMCLREAFTCEGVSWCQGKESSDKRKKRGEYKSKKKHAGLRAQASARHLQRGEGEEVAMAEPLEEVPEHDIWRQMSPRRKKKD